MSTDLFGVRVLAVDPQRLLVRFRIFVVYYDEAWGAEDMLPADPAFFFQALWESGDRAGGLLGDLVTDDEFLDEDWLRLHTRRFIRRLERVATRNLPITPEAWEKLGTFYYEHDGGWQDEDLLAQGDYEVEVTDVRWLEAVEVGGSWGTTSYPLETIALTGEPDLTECENWYAERAAEEDGHASFVLGWLCQERGESSQAVEHYRRAADDPDDDVRAKALRFLSNLHVAQRDYPAARDAYREALDCGLASEDARHYRAEAAFGLAAVSRKQGDEAAARAAFVRVEELGGPELVTRAHRLAGTETLAELARRVLADSGAEAARATIAEACGSAAVARFAVALAAADFDAATAALAEPADRELAAAVALDVSVLLYREREFDAVTAVAELPLSPVESAAGYRLAVRAGFLPIDPPERTPADAVVAGLTRRLRDSRDQEALALFGSVAVSANPRLAAEVACDLGRAARRRGEPTMAEEYLRQGAALAERAPQPAARCVALLGELYAERGETAAAREAYQHAEAAFEYDGEKSTVARRLAELLDGEGDWTGAAVAWLRSVYYETELELRGDRRQRDWSLHRLGVQLTELGESWAAEAAAGLVGESPRRNKGHAADSCAAFLFARDIHDSSHRELAETLLRSLTESKGKYAAKAARRLAVEAHRAGDIDTAITFLSRARLVGNQEQRDEATMYLGQFAKDRRDVAEALRLFGSLADSDRIDAGLAAAHLGELYYWVEDVDNALRWYRKSLDLVVAPEVAAEAACRVGELLQRRGEAAAAGPFLERAIATGDETFAPLAESLLAKGS